MQEVVLTVGLPASGKSTWAKKWAGAAEYRGIVCRDDIRTELFRIPNESTREYENRVLAKAEYRVCKFLSDGYSVCIADTNLSKNRQAQWEGMVKHNFSDVSVSYEDFTNVPLVVCLQRDLRRSQSRTEQAVGEPVIIRMWEQHLKGQAFLPVDKNLPYCIVCDIDGTIADNSHRSPYDYTKVAKDTRIDHVVTLLETHYAAYKKMIPIIFASGRPESARADTLEWLHRNLSLDSVDPVLLLRETGDKRPDYQVKESMASKILSSHQIQYWLDDRWQVTTHLRYLGIKVLSVDFGRF